MKQAQIAVVVSSRQVSILKALAKLDATKVEFPAGQLQYAVPKEVTQLAIPGLVASLVKKGLISTVKSPVGVLCTLTSAGAEYAALAA